MSRELGFACKYPSSDKQIQDKITEGYRQLRREQVPGIVAIGLDQVAFADLKSEGLNADNADAAARAADAILGRWVVQAIRDRKGLVAEAPLDGALFTLNVMVILNEEHGLVFLKRVGFQIATDQHPLKADFGLLAAGTKLLLG